MDPTIHCKSFFDCWYCGTTLRVKEVERPQVRKGPMSYNPGDFESQLAVDRPTKWNYGTLSEKIDLFCQ
ncbi:hypothetical protein OUZ56_007628 [Daphnia magna]|uniref:Uncharacterized protein n=1 Tax=Daphnia magna TaxID=35525 RepID=A0ABR0AAK0_9CRUS|nr:hypothetical protein OUZ56_007628 [Daphnia magna]